MPGEAPVGLAAEIDGAKLQFLYRAGGEWLPVGPVLDASVISDEGGPRRAWLLHRRLPRHGCVRHQRRALPADFSYFEYTRR